MDTHERDPSYFLSSRGRDERSHRNPCTTTWSTLYRRPNVTPRKWSQYTIGRGPYVPVHTLETD